MRMIMIMMIMMMKMKGDSQCTREGRGSAGASDLPGLLDNSRQPGGRGGERRGAAGCEAPRCPPGGRRPEGPGRWPALGLGGGRAGHGGAGGDVRGGVETCESHA